MPKELRRITFIVEMEVRVSASLTHNEIGELLRPNIKSHIHDINKYWAGGIVRVEAIYLPVLLGD